MMKRATLAGAMALFTAMTLAVLATPKAARAQGLVWHMTYRDSDGPGTLDLSYGDLIDKATGGLPISVQITQNGSTFRGYGFEVNLSNSNGQRVELLTFTVVGGNGYGYLFRGRITWDASTHVTGGGAIQLIGSGDVDTWSVSR